jgi:pyruvate formate lyase activating enzyme
LPFYKITYNIHGGMDRACVYNWGCNFRCRGCAYKIKPPGDLPRGDGPWLGAEEIRATLRRIMPKRVHFLGGEPTTNPMLPELARFAREELGAVTKVGHTNGSGRIPDFVDEAAFSIKAYSSDIHEAYTGFPNAPVLANFQDAHSRGLKVSASTVLIPGLVGVGEVGRVAEYVGGIDRGIRFHITAYMPVPGVAYAAPSGGELEGACALAKDHVSVVSCWSVGKANFFKAKCNSEAYDSAQVA